MLETLINIEHGYEISISGPKIVFYFLGLIAISLLMIKSNKTLKIAQAVLLKIVLTIVTSVFRRCGQNMAYKVTYAQLALFMGPLKNHNQINARNFTELCGLFNLPATRAMEKRYVVNRIISWANKCVAISNRNHNQTDSYTKKLLASTEIVDSDQSLDFILNNRSIICLPHTGDYWVNVYLVGVILAQSDLNVLIAVNDYDEKSQRAVDAHDKYRGRIRFLPIHENGTMRKLIAAKRREDTRIVFLYDLSGLVGSVENGNVSACRFMDRIAYFTDGPFRFAQRAGLPITFVHGRIKEKGGFKLVFQKPKGSSAEELFQEGVDKLEKVVSEDPSDWYFMPYIDTYFHDRSCNYGKYEKISRQIIALLNKY